MLVDEQYKKNILKYLEEYQKTIDYSDLYSKLYEEANSLLEKISKNSSNIYRILDVDKISAKKWELIFTPFLRYFLISIVYKKNFYNYLKKENKDLSFLKDDINKKTIFFFDHNDFMFNSNNLDWNIFCLKIFYECDLYHKNNYNFFDNFKYEKKKLIPRKNKSSKFESLIKLLYSILLKKKYCYFPHPTRFTKLDMLKLFIKTNRGVYFDFFEENYPEIKERLNLLPNLNLREELNNILVESKDFDYPISIILSIFLPMSKIENLNYYKLKSYKKNFKNKNLKAIFSQGSHIDQEHKLHEYAKFLKNEKNIFVVQHGNNYDLIEKKFHTGIETEYLFENNLLTWGWSNSKVEKAITSPRLIKFKKECSIYKYKKNRENILYVLGQDLQWYFPKSLHQSHTIFFEQSEMRKNFLKNLNDDNKKKLIFRLYPYKVQDGMKGYDQKMDFNEFNVSNKKKFSADAANIPLAIFENLSTANLEYAILGKPFLIYFKLKNFPLSKNGQKIFKDLKDNQILHDDHNSICNLLSKINLKNFLEWWNQKRRKNAVDAFKNNYAYFSENPIDEWADIINLENKC